MLRGLIMAAGAAACTLLTPTVATTQQMSVGALGGVNIAKFGGDDAEGTKNRTGFAAGIQLVRTLGANVALELDGLYATKGTKGSEDGTDLEAKLSYIEIPLLLRIGPTTTTGVRPFATVGGSFGVRTGCTFSGREGGVSVSFDCDELDVDIKKTDLTALVGAGLDAKAGSGTFTVAVRYGVGLTQLAEDDDIKNRTFSVLAGFRMPFGRQ